MNQPQDKVRVTRTNERRTPKSLRKLGRALIALAQAQLEAEAQAQTEAKNAGSKRPKPGGDATPEHSGDAA